MPKCSGSDGDAHPSVLYAGDACPVCDLQSYIAILESYLQTLRYQLEERGILPNA